MKLPHWTHPSVAILVIFLSLSAAGVGAYFSFHPPKPANVTKVSPSAIAEKIAVLIRDHPDEWSDDGWSMYNKNRDISVKFGRMYQMGDDDFNGATITVNVDGVEMPGFKNDSSQPNENQRIIYEQLKRWYDETLEIQKNARDLAEKRAIEKLLKEPV